MPMADPLYRFPRRPRQSNQLITVEEWDAMQAARQADAESGMTV
jgi:hypothetical protein